MTRTPSTTDDRTLIERIGRGDRQAFGCFHRRWYGRIFAYLHGLQRDRCAAEDLSQEVFLKVWRSAAQQRKGASPQGWLFAIARNAAVDRGRRSRNHAPLDDGFVEPVSTEPDGLRRLAGRRRLERLLDLLATEAPEHRELVLLSRFSELSASEVGELLGCSPGAVRVRLHRVLKRLGAALEHEEA